MADNEQKALQLIAEAEKKLTTQKGFFGQLFGCVFSPVSFCMFFGILISKGIPKIEQWLLSNEIIAN